MKRVAYDGTYILKGSSGIPTDAKNTLKCLTLLDLDQLDVYFFDYQDTIKPTQIEISEDDVIKLTVLQILIRILKRLFFILPYSKNLYNFLIRTIYRIKRVYQSFKAEINTRIVIKMPDALEEVISSKKNLDFYSVGMTTLERFIPVKFFKRSLRLDTTNYEYFIQQQIDPIQVGKNTKHIVRLHDILPVTHPQFFTTKGRTAFKTGLNQLLKNNQIIWAMDTQASADEFKIRYGYSRNVIVIPCVVGDKFKEDRSLDYAKENIILMVNTIEPRKNIKLVIDAFLKISTNKQIDESWKLVIAGTPGWKSTEIVENLRIGYFGKQVIFLESPSDVIIHEMYKKAKFVISASEAEGFGLPPLEGMKNECIPIVSNIKQHRETIGKNAIFFNLSEKTVEEVMILALNNYESYRKEFISENKRRVETLFSIETISNIWSELIKG